MMLSGALLNNISVAVFGIILSAAFCDIVWTNQKKWIIAGSVAGILLIQGIVMLFGGVQGVRYLYPVITHLPLVLILWAISKKGLWSFITVLTSYLCCQLRRWLALLIVAITPVSAVTQPAAELLITFPLLFLLIWFVAPSVRTISHYTFAGQCQFGLIPLLAYAFDYLTSVYNDWLAKGTPLAVEFMFFLCCVAYLMSVLRSSDEERARNELEQMRGCLNLQVTQAVREIKFLRESQQKSSTYRHDLRHHMQYVLACIENERLEQAKTYIQGICSEIEANKVITFCENEAANLIFSSFAGRAKEYGISMAVRAEISQNCRITESDLCVLLSNALENALHACQKRTEKGLSAEIKVSAYEENKKLFIQVVNTCDEVVHFRNGIPITDHPGHGIGVRSICTLVEWYGGIYMFDIKDNEFILRMSL